MALPPGSRINRLLHEVYLFQNTSLTTGTIDPSSQQELASRVQNAAKSIVSRQLLRRLNSAQNSLSHLPFALHVHRDLLEFMTKAKKDVETFDPTLLSAARLEELGRWCQQFMTQVRTVEFAMAHFQMSTKTSKELSDLYKEMRQLQSALEMGLSRLKEQIPPPSGLLGLFCSHPIDPIASLLDPNTPMLPLNLMSYTLRRWAQSAIPQHPFELRWIDQSPQGHLNIDHHKLPPIPPELLYLYTVSYLFSTERGKDPQFASQIRGVGWKTVGQLAWEELDDGEAKETILRFATIDLLTNRLKRALKNRDNVSVQDTLSLLTGISCPEISREFTIGDLLHELLRAQLCRRNLDLNPALRGAGFVSGPFGSINLEDKLEVIRQLREVVHESLPFPLNLVDFKFSRL